MKLTTKPAATCRVGDMPRPVETFTSDSNLPPGLGEIMARAAATRWLVVLADGRKFYLMGEERARKFCAANPESTIYPPL